MVKTASNNINVLLHRLNNTHLLTYCSAQLTRTLNCKHRLQNIGFSISLCIMCDLKLLVQFAPWYIASQNECSREHLLPGIKVPGNFRSRKRKFPGTFVTGSENTSERKVPEPSNVVLGKMCICSSQFEMVDR